MLQDLQTPFILASSPVAGFVDPPPPQATSAIEAINTDATLRFPILNLKSELFD
jgi:hypothetical protein